jgi:hypothetical protein
VHAADECERSHAAELRGSNKSVGITLSGHMLVDLVGKMLLPRGTAFRLATGDHESIRRHVNLLQAEQDNIGWWSAEHVATIATAVAAPVPTSANNMRQMSCRIGEKDGGGGGGGPKMH